MIWLALVFAGLIYWLARAAFKLGKVIGKREGIEDSIPQVAEAGEEGFRAGWRSCDAARQAADTLGVPLHVEQQRRAGWEGRQ